VAKKILALLVAVGAALPAGGVTPDLQKQIRASTFEVVLKKPGEGSVVYEKPLPLELLPYVERTDLYRSIGTAFALGDNRYVTAAHVLSLAAGSQYGTPALRASDGTVHPIATIQQFSAFEDFVVFSIADDGNPRPLPLDRTPHVDDQVLAVGNALGEGIVIRDGLFTSETPEEQDGRWKWIRFSAAASPGNSGGPLLDAAGDVIGVVIAKSPNENLNYALPISSVLDAPPSKARFNQRLVTKLPYAQASKTYELKDEFALPLSWERFVLAFKAVLDRHTDAARAALMTTYASSMFPRGSGTETILYGSDDEDRELAIVAQEPNDEWAIQAPEYQFTSLPGDGKVGVASAAGALLVTLHRGNHASDDAFYADSKAFMDIALKALNLRRPVGQDQVKVVSLGAATTDVTSADAYGRTWQVRVWPIPYLDTYLVAQLLPTPDGYAGIVEYAPSIGLREAKIQLSMLGNQASVNYLGTIAQWRAFLGRPTLLPNALKTAALESGPEPTLHTRRFELSVPPSLMKMDSKSELLVSMSFMPDGTKVVWDVGGARWYRDAQEKASLSLWRKQRPPASAKLETRTRFDDLRERRSPYDGSPVLISADTIDVSMSLEVPGTKEGTASSDVAYDLDLHLDGHPALERIALAQEEALGAAHILERGVGQDVAAAAAATISTQWEALLKTVRERAKQYDSVGKDFRGRLYSEDVEQFITPLYQSAFRIPTGSADAPDMRKTFTERAKSLQDYWSVAPAVVHNRDLWQPFLLHNEMPADTTHSAEVLAAESSLNALVSAGGAPTADWAARSRALSKAYIDERTRVARKAALENKTRVNTYHKRKSSCPAPAVGTSGTDKPRAGPVTHSLSEFYPVALRRQAVEGLVVLSLKIDSSGCATEAAVIGSSGSDELDEAALKWVETASFLPAEKDGKPVDGTTPLAMAFKLNE
jgi:TonB family protein